MADATAEGPPSFAMIERAGSMLHNVANIATKDKWPVANIETDAKSAGWQNRYMLNRWLAQAIKRKGLSQAEMARQLTIRLGRSIDRAAVNKMIQGSRKIAGDEALAISEITDSPIPQKPIERLVPLVGYVSAGAAANYTAAGELGEVEAPADVTDSTVAVEIRGDSLGSFFDRWLVFYDDVRRPLTTDLIGRLCVVGLEDGRVLVKKPQRSRTKGLFHLFSQTEDPILDASIEWAAKVKSMVPR